MFCGLSQLIPTRYRTPAIAEDRGVPPIELSEAIRDYPRGSNRLNITRILFQDPHDRGRTEDGICKEAFERRRRRLVEARLPNGGQ